jgi:hypothetical protein
MAWFSSRWPLDEDFAMYTRKKINKVRKTLE